MKLSPLPIAPSDASPKIAPAENNQQMHGFVDEDAILELIDPTRAQRPSPSVQDLILTADEDDFAGWMRTPKTEPRQLVAVAPPSPQPPVSKSSATAISLNLEKQRPAAPKLTFRSLEQEPGIGAPHSGGHRWWIATVAGLSLAALMAGGLITHSLKTRHEIKSTHGTSEIWWKSPATQTAVATESKNKIHSTELSLLTPSVSR
ncbi:hypothetical protein JIN85_06700 [Luteolibacter pohnpeiensis]|uniref:Transmembrane protein n=1 Tax=Luteolibacter pohnpeiensis TaxID=454153 RepID=A0A934VW30_9BACT|nr:hypothetical protein [Luteolibacter pohnpeiensis]MBK1882094.1 hypothetical protein [Luteolibacter pohnpeiensis]